MRYSISIPGYYQSKEEITRLGSGFTVPSDEALKESRPISLQEIVEICKEYQPKINKYYQDKHGTEKEWKNMDKN